MKYIAGIVNNPSDSTNVVLGYSSTNFTIGIIPCIITQNIYNSYDEWMG